MPNGIDKNLVRLSVCVGVYRARFGGWPTHARLDPIVLWDLAQILNTANFERLSTLMQLRTQAGGMSVGGPPGIQRYEDVNYDIIPSGAIEEARRWLDVETRPELGHYG